MNAELKRKRVDEMISSKKLLNFNGLSNVEKERILWLLQLRSDRPLSREHRDLLVDRLFDDWFPGTPRRGPKVTQWQIGNHNFRAMALRNEVRKVQAETGGRRDDAELAVAERLGIGRRQLNRLMRDKPLKTRIS